MKFGHLVAASSDGIIRAWKSNDNTTYKIIDTLDLLDYVSKISDLTPDERLELKRPYQVRSKH